MSSATAADPTRPLPAAKPAPLFRGRLPELLPALTAELRRTPTGVWLRRSLRGGAHIALRVTPDERRLLAIQRDERPQADAQWAKWAREIEIFVNQFGVGHWQGVEQETARGVAVGFLELWKGEVAPGKAVCARCTTPIRYTGLYAEELCELCARLAGDDETRTLNERSTPS